MKLFKKLFLIMLVVSVLFVSCGNNEIKTPGNDNIPESNVPGTDPVKPGTDEPVLNPSLKGPDPDVNPDALNPEYYFVGITKGDYDFPQNYLMAKMTDEQYEKFVADIKTLVNSEDIEVTVTKTPETGKFSVVVEGIATVIQYGDGSWYFEVNIGDYQNAKIRQNVKLMTFDDFPAVPADLKLKHSMIGYAGKYAQIYMEGYAFKGTDLKETLTKYAKEFSDEWTIDISVPTEKNSPYDLEMKCIKITGEMMMITREKDTQLVTLGRPLPLTVDENDYTALGFMLNNIDFFSNIVPIENMSNTPNYTKMTRDQFVDFNSEIKKLARQNGFDLKDYDLRLVEDETDSSKKTLFITLGKFQGGEVFKRCQKSDGSWVKY